MNEDSRINCFAECFLTFELDVHSIVPRDFGLPVPMAVGSDNLEVLSLYDGESAVASLEVVSVAVK